MKTIEMSSILKRMVELLAATSHREWADALSNVQRQLSTDAAMASSDILRMYGGLGSLNDIVLYRDDQPLIDENVEFDRLRTKLYELCH
jgi:uncharacterized protein YjgD (DUF1641 family)